MILAGHEATYWVCFVSKKKTHSRNSQMRSKLQSAQSGMAYTLTCVGRVRHDKKQTYKLAAFDVYIGMLGHVFSV